MKNKTKVQVSDQKIFDEVLAQIQVSNPGEDNAGRTPLEAIADSFSMLKRNSKEEGDFLRAFSRLLQEIPSLDDAHVESLATFLLQCDRWSSKMKETISRLLDRMAARAEIPFHETVIGQEGEVLKVRPWVWFDFAISVAPARAANHARMLISEPGFLRAMWVRIPSLMKKLDKSVFAEFLECLITSIRPDEMAELKEILIDMGIDFPTGYRREEQINYFAQRLDTALGPDENLSHCHRIPASQDELA